MRLLCLFVVFNTAIVAAQPALFSPDSAHLWNRLHNALWLRVDSVGEVFGADRLDPLLWRDTQALLVGDSQARAVENLEEFAVANGASQVNDPLKRAVLQRDLWAVYDWLQGDHAADSSLVATAKRHLNPLLSTLIRQLALSAAEIAQLPDNYAAAVASGRYAATFDPQSPEEPFLPSNLFDRQGPWVLLGRNEGPVARQHVAALDGATRSTFLVFIRLPAGREATEAYLAALRAFDAPAGPMPLDVPQFPPDAQLALVRQALLIDTEGNLQPSPLTESVQIRVHGEVPEFRGNPEVEGLRVFEFRLSRAQLFAGEAGGLRAIGTEERDFHTGFRSHGIDWIESQSAEGHAATEAQGRILGGCSSCHGASGSYAFNSYFDFRGRRWKDGSFPAELWPSHLAQEREVAVTWKEGLEDWQALKAIWASTAVETAARPLPDTFQLLAVYPNPFNGSVQVVLEVEWAQWMGISLYDLLGQQVVEGWQGWLPQGRHALELRAAGLASGVFICRVQGASGRQVAKIAHLK